jgi:hypothetical protein
VGMATQTMNFRVIWEITLTEITTGATGGD